MAAATASTTTTGTAKTTPLVLSYSGLLYALAGKLTTLGELEGALFYMGCQPTAVFSRDVVERYLGHHEELTYEQRTELHDKLQELIKHAYDDGRVLWHKGDLPTWAELNELLKAHGLPQIDPTSYHYSYPGVREAIEAQQLPYTIAHHC